MPIQATPGTRMSRQVPGGLEESKPSRWQGSMPPSEHNLREHFEFDVEPGQGSCMADCVSNSKAGRDWAVIGPWVFFLMKIISPAGKMKIIYKLFIVPQGS